MKKYYLKDITTNEVYIFDNTDYLIYFLYINTNPIDLREIHDECLNAIENINNNLSIIGKFALFDKMPNIQNSLKVINLDYFRIAKINCDLKLKKLNKMFYNLYTK